MAAARGTRTGVAATTAALACAAWARGGFSVNHMDIAPAQAGLVMGVSNTAGTLAGRPPQHISLAEQYELRHILLVEHGSQRPDSCQLLTPTVCTS